jgi:hypothetical protein
MSIVNEEETDTVQISIIMSWIKINPVITIGNDP